MPTKKASQRTKAHTRYYVKGKRVPSATTILSVMAKPALIKWANNLGLKGVDSNKYRDKMAGIGTCAHLMVASHLRNEDLDLSEFAVADIGMAENAFLKYLEWEKGKLITPILMEQPLTSETDMYGGTVDCYAEIDGVATLLDFKTGKAVYPEHIAQLAAYATLLNEAGRLVQVAHILRIGRDETEGFEVHTYRPAVLERHWHLFQMCLALYVTRRELKY